MKQEIPPSEWQEFCHMFSRKHGTWLITVEENSVTPILHQPLGRITVENGNVLIKAGEQTILLEPLSMILIKTDDGADQSLEIKAMSGRVSLRIDSPTLPEMVDGTP